MAISLNYKFLLRISIWLTVSTAVLSVLLMQVLGHHEEMVPVWGQESMATDLLVYSPILGFIVGLVSTKLTHRALRSKRVLPLHWHLKSQTLIDRLPNHIIHRAFMLGLAGALIASILLFLFRVRKIEQVPYQDYLAIFLLHAISLAGAIVVMSVYRALGDYAMLRQVKAKKQSTTNL